MTRTLLPRRAPKAVSVVAGLLMALLLSPIAAVVTAAPAQAAETPPFTECPTIGADSSCGLLIDVDAAGHLVVYADSTQPPVDDIEDTLIGVVNHWPGTVSSLSLSVPGTDIFGFDGDGLCSASPHPLDCPFGPTGYEGPGTSFSDIGNGNTSGVVHFDPPLLPGDVAYFSLEEAIPASVLDAGAPVPDPSTFYGGFNGTMITEPPCAGDPVNCESGDFNETTTDLAVPGRGFPLDMSRTYNSLDAAGSSALGAGWAFTYGMHVSFDAATNAATVVQENGSTVRFSAGAVGNWFAPPYSFSTFVKNGDGTYTFTRFNRDTITFSSAGKVLSERDVNGYVTTMAYDGSGRLATVTDPSGRALTFAYGADGFISSVTDPAGRNVAYGHDGAGNLTSVRDVTGATTSFAYDASHFLLTATDGRGGVVANTYDGAGRVVQQQDPQHRVTGFAYGSSMTTITDPAGVVTEEHFDKDHLLVSRTVGAGTADALTWTYTYNPLTFGRETVTDPAGHVSYSSYDSNGNLVSATDAVGRAVSLTYNSRGEPLTRTDPTGVTTSFTYDGAGNVLSESRPAPGGSQSVAFTHGDAAHPEDVTDTTDPAGKHWLSTYDAYGDLTAQRDPLGNKQTYTYDIVGRRTTAVSPKGNVTGANPAAYRTAYAYDAGGRRTSLTDPLGHRSTAVYDANGNLVSSTDPANQTTAYAYDADNALLSTTRPDGSVSSTTYDGAGRKATETDAGGRLTTYFYDALGRIRSVTEAGWTTTLTYDRAGNVATVTDPQGRVTTKSYDAANEVVGLSFSDGTPAVAYTYNGRGQMTHEADGTAFTRDLAYDSIGRLSSVSETRVQGSTTATQSAAYGYDLLGHITSVHPCSTSGVCRTFTRAFDADGRMTSVSDGAGHATTFGYDVDSNLVTEALPNADSVAYSYDAADQLTNTAAALALSQTATFPSPRSALGQITADNETGTAVGPNRGYQYDHVGRLTGVSSSGADWANYGYDSGGQLTSWSDATANRSFAYNGAGRLTSATLQPPVAPATHIGFTFGQAGQRTGESDDVGNTVAFGYDLGNRMTSYDGPATSALGHAPGVPVHKTYGYDSEGLRTDLLWDSSAGMPLVLGDEFGNLYVNGPDGRPVEQVAPDGTARYYVHDQLGSTRLLLNGNGTADVTYSYDAYGNVRPSASTVANPIQFAGQYADSDTGLVYMRARWYDPASAQFVTPDPAVSVTGQPYSYGDDDPANKVDPLGLAAYHYSFDLGPLGTPTELAAYTRANCSSLFPIAGCVDNFQVGDTMHLHKKMLFYTQSFPVQVIGLTSTSWQFVALDGHPEGEGRTITFSFCVGDNGHTMLHIDTSDDGSILTNWWGIRDLDFLIAKRTWKKFASNIEANYDYTTTDGAPPPEDA